MREKEGEEEDTPKMALRSISSLARLPLAVALALLSLTSLLPGAAGVEGSPTYPCPHPPNSRPPMPPQAMPKLAQQFVVHVEANIVQKNSTSEAVEVYDFPNQRAAMSITTNNQTGDYVRLDLG